MDEIPDQIGERLRRARESAGLEVEDVVFQTRLPRSAVEALESDNFSHFVSPVYAKSFLAQYSEYLAVDATRWLDALQPSSFIEGDPMLPLLNTLVPPHAEHSHHHHHHQSGESNIAKWFSAFWLLALSCGLVFAVVKAYQHYEERFSAEDGPRTKETSKKNPPAAKKRSEPENPPPEPPANSPPKAEEQDTVHRPPRAIIVR